MLRIFPALGVFLLLNACSNKVNSYPQTSNLAQANVESCPQAKEVALPALQKNQGFYDRFDFHVRNISVDANTVKFQSLNQDFVLCRANNTWTVQPRKLDASNSNQNYQEIAKNLVNPRFENINFQGKVYQYRVVNEPRYTLGKEGNITRRNVSDPSQDKVVFELLLPGNQKPVRQTLYTLKDLQRGGFSAQVGFPRITATVTHGNSLWWSVAFEQGEGNDGIGTVVNYDISTQKFSLIQPQQLKSQQITDLVVTGDTQKPTLWMGTQVSGEGNPYIPSLGLVSYRPDGTFKAYTVHNSPLVGGIPDKLRLENDNLWVGTGNGVCQVKWQAADNPQSWNCWRFAAMAKLPAAGLPLYNSSTSKTSTAKLSPSQAGETAEVLWWSPLDFQTGKGRFEVRYPQGFTVTLNQEAKPLEAVRRRWLSPGQLPVAWAGVDWHWNGVRFVRGWDEVQMNVFGGGPVGIGTQELSPNAPRNTNAIRGDLEILKLSLKSTTVKYYSGWVDEGKLKPYLTVLPQEKPVNVQPHPLASVLK